MALTHSARCIEQTQAHDAFMRKYPRACMNCGATGVIAYPSTRDDPGGSDPCPQCVENGRCPRCGAQQPEDFSGEHCDACHWHYDDGEITNPNDGPMYMPHNECVCAFEVVCPDCKGTGTVMVVVGEDEPYPAICSDCGGKGHCWMDGPIDIPIQTVEMFGVIHEILLERDRQDKKWGGPAHDDIHNPVQWSRLIFTRTQTLMTSVLTLHIYRQLLIEIAAMCVAAVQTLDRQRKGTTNGKEAVRS